MTRDENVTLKDVSTNLADARERLVAVETTLGHMAKALDGLAADVRVNTAATVVSTTKAASTEVNEAERHQEVIEALLRDGRVRGWIFGVAAAIGTVVLSVNVLVQWVMA